MRLELQLHHVTGIEFGPRTELREGTLYVDVKGLQDCLLADPRLRGVDVELASPGEDCRIIKVADVVEPRYKVTPQGTDFPGALTPAEGVGHGITRVLKGAAVVTTDQMPSSRENFPIPLGGARVLDMKGPCAPLTTFASTYNVVLLPYPSPTATAQEYHTALRYAGWRAAVYLAQQCGQSAPETTEVFDLPPLPEITKGIESLPKVGYIYQVWSHQSPSQPWDPVFYGDNVGQLLPTAVHPCEVIDGAVLNGASRIAIGGETYTIQNHPVVMDLLRRHGKDLCFVGVVLTVSPDSPVDRSRNASMAASIAKWVLGADGVILTKLGGGAPQADLALIAEKCERLGVKNTIIVQEVSVDGSADAAITIATPYADAIVSAGTGDEMITLPAVARIIGGDVATPVGAPPNGENRVKINTIAGATSQIGAGRLVGIEY